MKADTTGLTTSQPKGIWLSFVIVYILHRERWEDIQTAPTIQKYIEKARI